MSLLDPSGLGPGDGNNTVQGPSDSPGTPVDCSSGTTVCVTATPTPAIPVTIPDPCSFISCFSVVGGDGTGPANPGNPYIFKINVIGTQITNLVLQQTRLLTIPFAPSNGGCIVVNGGTTVCPSKIDNLFNPNHRGKFNYRDSSPICSTHTLTDMNGQNPQSHIDLYNPTSYVPGTPMGQSNLLLHFIYDQIPDAIYDVFHQYWLPAGRDQCK